MIDYMTTNIDNAFAAYDRFQFKTEAAWNKGNPECLYCGRRIDDTDCYVLDEAYEPFGSCVCVACMKKRVLPMIRAGLGKHGEVADYIEGLLENTKTVTPHDEDAEDDIWA